MAVLISLHHGVHYIKFTISAQAPRSSCDCTIKALVLYITEKGGILVPEICILYINPHGEYFGILCNNM